MLNFIAGGGMAAPMVLTCRDLYDLVWPKPMRDAAEDLGIADVGLSKVCDRHRVPRPAWRIKFGQLAAAMGIGNST